MKRNFPLKQKCWRPLAADIWSSGSLVKDPNPSTKGVMEPRTWCNPKLRRGHVSNQSRLASEIQAHGACVPMDPRPRRRAPPCLPHPVRSCFGETALGCTSALPAEGARDSQVLHPRTAFPALHDAGNPTEENGNRDLIRRLEGGGRVEQLTSGMQGAPGPAYLGSTLLHPSTSSRLVKTWFGGPPLFKIQIYKCVVQDGQRMLLI